MSILSLSLSYLRYHFFQNCLHILLMALGLMLMSMILLISSQAENRFYRDGAGIDMVMGAKGSPLQLILSTIHHIDIPSGNIPYAEAQKILNRPDIKQAIPIGLGDNYHNFRIVGTTPEYITHFKATFQKGRLWTDKMQVVLGADVAKTTGLKIGSVFAGSHGLVQNDDVHSDNPYRVTGILNSTGTVLDRLIITPLESVWQIHDTGHHHHHESREGEHHHKHEQTESKHHHDITAMLVTYQTRLVGMNLPRMINMQTNFQAASPAYEIARITQMLGFGTESLRGFSLLIIAIAMTGIFIHLFQSLGQRRYDLSMMRVLGASPLKICSLILLEGMSIVLIGGFLGLFLGHFVTEMLGLYTTQGLQIGLKGFIILPEIYGIFALILGICFMICLLPARSAYYTNIRKVLLGEK